MERDVMIIAMHSWDGFIIGRYKANIVENLCSKVSMYEKSTEDIKTRITQMTVAFMKTKVANQETQDSY